MPGPKAGGWARRDLLVLFAELFGGGKEGKGRVELDAFLAFFDASRAM